MAGEDHKALGEPWGSDPASQIASLNRAIEQLVREVKEQAKWRGYHKAQQEKTECERDDYALAARVEASARRDFMRERDEALEVLRDAYEYGWDRLKAERILAKHEVKS